MLSNVAARAVRSASLARASTAARTWRTTSPALPLIWAKGMAKNNSPDSSSRFANTQKPSDEPSSTADSSKTPSSSTEPPSSEATESEKEKEIPFNSLPDLTQGIPSTLEYETTGATRSALTAANEEAESGGRGKGELPASAYVSSSERNRQKATNYILASAIGTIAAGTVYAGRNWDDDEEKRHPDAPNGWGLGLWWNRATTRAKEVMTYYHEPAFEKLLPDVDPMFERPYTLCISLEDLLVHSEWTRDHGWRVAKRPGVDYFLQYLSQYYELVLFTSVPFAMGDPLVRKLDPFRFIVWPLYREATKFEDGEVVKVSNPRTSLLKTHPTNQGTGPILPEPRPLQGHHHRHQREARSKPA